MKTKLSKEAEEKLGQVTTEDYWDCGCKKNYIHSKAKGTYCPLCDTYEDEMPDSRVTEVYSLYDPEYDTAVKSKRVVKFLMGIQVIKVYNIEVEARDEDEAYDKVISLPSTQIEEEGYLIEVETDHPTIVEELT